MLILKKKNVSSHSPPLKNYKKGFWLLFIFGLPFVLKLPHGRRSLTNRNQGYSFRADYALWSPEGSEVDSMLDKLSRDLPQAYFILKSEI